jgi:outer membrane protein OmpA-like peptidoglycan-associated protein
LEGFTREKDFLEADNPNSPVSGYKELANVAVTVTTEDTTFTLKSSSKGTFAFELKENRDYRFTAVKDGYFKGNGYLTTRELFKDPANPVQTLRVEITLDKIFKDKEIVLENIYYDFDKWDIRQDARPALDRLSEILKDNPTINIELASHTDCRGNDGYNLSLSQKRAESVVQYLIARGIARERLSARGYGETSPIETCDCRQCTEEQHQANRRTTFKVI